MAIAVPLAPAASYISNTPYKVQTSRKNVPDPTPSLVKEKATKEVALCGMKDSNWDHFVCHGN